MCFGSVGEDMRRVIMAALCAAAISAPARADPPAQTPTPPPPAAATAPAPESLRAAREMFEAMHYQDAIDAIFAALIPQVTRAELSRYQGLTEAQQTAMQDAVMESLRALEPDMVEAMAVVYARNFPLEDLIAIRDFYRSRAGQRLANETRQLDSQAQDALVRLLPRMEQLLRDNLCRRVDCQQMPRPTQS